MSGWKYTLAATRAEAEALPDAADLFDDLPSPPTLLVDEPDPDRPDDWLLAAYFDGEPTADVLTRVEALAPSAAGRGTLEELPDDDWTTLSQRGLEPVRAGRFLVHTPAHADAVRPGDWAIDIEAGLAFGTGQHATTHGCLQALDRLAKGRRRRNILDLGTGSGVLAIAAARAWPDAAIIASDIDPVSVTVTRANLVINRVMRGRAAGHIELAVATGMANRRIAARGPYTLVTANILAGPLVAMSREIARAVAPGGDLILAGLLDFQALRVRAAYRRHGLIPKHQHPRGEWPTLVLTRPVRPATRGTTGRRRRQV